MRRGLFLLLVAASILEAGWTPPSSVSGCYSYVGRPDLAVGPDGNAIAVWEAAGGGDLIQGAVLSRGASSWTAMKDLASDGYLPRVAVDGQGRATSIWSQLLRRDLAITGASPSASGGTSWCPTDPVFFVPGSDGDEYRLAVDPAGTAFTIFSVDDCVSRTVVASSLTPTGVHWTEPTLLSRPENRAGCPQIAVDDNGYAVALWEEGGQIQSSTYNPQSATWSSPIQLAPGRQPQVAVDLEGNAVALWLQNQTLRSARLPFGASCWIAAKEPLTVDGADHRVAIDGAGNAVAVWTQLLPSGWTIQAASLPFEVDTWTPSQELIGSGVDSFDPSLAVAPNGNAIVAWSRTDPVSSHLQVRAATLPTGHTVWSPAFTLSPATGDGVTPITNFLTDQTPIVLWTQISDEGYSIQYAIGTDVFLPIAPTRFSGRRIKNRFLTHTDVIHRLTWTPSPDPEVVGYLIRRNGTLIATLSASDPCVFEDHNRHDHCDTYTLVALSRQGIESASQTVRIY
jgi:hypothetical protein